MLEQRRHHRIQNGRHTSGPLAAPRGACAEIADEHAATCLITAQHASPRHAARHLFTARRNGHARVETMPRPAPARRTLPTMNTITQTRDRFLSRVTSLIRGAADVERVILFGSRARDDARPDSDY